MLVTFDLARDIDVAAQDVRDRIAKIARDLPREADPPIVSKFDNDQTPVLTLAVSGDRPQRELTEIADKLVKIRSNAARASARSRSSAARNARSTWVDVDRLAAYQIPITAVRDAIQRQNAEAPGGNVSGVDREEVLRTLGRIEDPAAFDELVIATVNGVPVRVRDIGDAEDGTKEVRSTARLDGVPTVTLEIRRQSGSNQVAVIEGIKQRLDELLQQISRATSGSRSSVTNRGSSTPHSARSKPGPLGPRQHPRLPRRARVHAQLALDPDRRHRDPGPRWWRRSARWRPSASR